MAAGYTDDVALMGRWLSDAYKRYMDLSPSHVADLCTAMAHVEPDSIGHSTRTRLERALERIKDGQ